jgi:hypothetical protein
MRAFAAAAAAGGSAAEGRFGTHTTMMYDHPDALLEQCVTSPTDFLSVSGPALYTDREFRLYRPRVVKTEEANQMITMVDRSERTICFDVYIPPLTTHEKEKNPHLEKAGRITPGDSITLICRRVHKADMETVREFTVDVIDVNWGEYHNTPVDSFAGDENAGRQHTKRKLNDNLGFIQCNVRGSFPRSLIIDPAYRLQKRSVMAM